MNYEVINNIEARRFEIHINGKIAFVKYDYFTTDQGDKGISYTHTEVPPELSGQGIATYLVKHILNDAAQQGLKVEPACSFVKAYIDKHPEYQANTV